MSQTHGFNLLLTMCDNF